ncbi:hypothetical protein [Escherichia coli]|uniref:hypothetical protein n=1 Tax=Escherichia coli TaxID=562 RepID=UPI002542859B|nr:hypothetical protein [Escherichia coli]
MLTSKEAKNNANNHSLQACQSGTWRKVGSGELQYKNHLQVGLGRFKLEQQLPVQLENVLQVAEVVPIDMPDSNGEMTWQANTLRIVRAYFDEDQNWLKMAYTVIEPF